MHLETADFTLKPSARGRQRCAFERQSKTEGARAVCSTSHRRHPGPVSGAAARRLVGGAACWVAVARRCPGGAHGLLRVHVLGHQPQRAVQRHGNLGSSTQPVAVVSVRWPECAVRGPHHCRWHADRHLREEVPRGPSLRRQVPRRAVRVHGVHARPRPQRQRHPAVRLLGAHRIHVVSAHWIRARPSRQRDAPPRRR